MESPTWQSYYDLGFSIIPIYGIRSDGGCQCGQTNCLAPGKHPKIAWSTYQKKFPTPAQLRVWFRDPETNIGIVTGQISSLVVVDEDAPGAAEPLHLTPTLMIQTGSGKFHYYYRCTTLVKSGPLCPYVDLKAEGGFVVAPPSRHRSGGRYTVVNTETPMTEFPLITPTGNVQFETPSLVLSGQRNVTLTREAGSLLGRGVPPEQVYKYLWSFNLQNCVPPLPEREVLTIVKGIAESESSKRASVSQFRDEAGTIPPLSPTAKIGLIKRLLDVATPYTEACDEAILFSFLTGFGNKIGRSAFVTVGASRHYGNLFTILIGSSSKARKGTAVDVAAQIFEPPPSMRVNFTATPWRFQSSGIASGEGLIEWVRDDRTEYDKTLKAVVTVEGTGVVDKRLSIVEPEFGSVIRKANSKTSTIWPTLRNLWDSGNCQNMTRHLPITTTNAHVSLIGNITKYEFIDVFPILELTSGTANRFLWVWSYRPRLLPLGPAIPANKLLPLQQEVDEAVKFGQKMTEMRRSKTAEDLWASIYLQEETTELPGTLGGATARQSVLMVRLQLLYALLDQSTEIRVEHVEAARDAVEYSKKTLVHLFRGDTGSPLANKIINALEDLGGDATKTDIRSLLKTTYPAREFDAAYRLLHQTGWISEGKKPASARGGPSATVIRLLK